MPDAVDLESEYNNRARVPDHGTHIAGWHRKAEAYRGSAACELDIPYGLAERHRLDLFFPPGGDQGGPVVFFIHGGYWQALDKSSASHLARGANARGLTVAVPSYDLAPTVGLKDILYGIERAADFVMERTGRAIVASGHSAGGHLAACLMARPIHPVRPVRAAMPISGLFDLSPLVTTSINRALGLTEDEARSLSPILWPPPTSGHLVSIVGEAESGEFRRQSREIVEHWDRAGVATRLHEVAGAHHFDVLDGLTDPGDILVEHLVRLAYQA